MMKRIQSAVDGKTDKRFVILALTDANITEFGKTPLYTVKELAVAERIESVMWREEKLLPDLDFYSAVAFHFCGIPRELFTPVFVMAGTSG